MAGEEELYHGPERRRYDRNAADELYVEIDRTIFPVINCSYGGVVVIGYDGPRKASAILFIDAAGLDPDDLEPVSIKARVVRRDDDAATLGLAFLDLDSEAYRVLSQVI